MKAMSVYDPRPDVLVARFIGYWCTDGPPSEQQEAANALVAWEDGSRHKVVASYRDTCGPSPSHIWKRRGLGRALEELRASQADGLIIDRRRSLGSTAAMRETIAYELGKNGWYLVTADGKWVPGQSHLARTVEQVTNARHEIHLLRSGAARDLRRAEGRGGAGNAPYGYRVEDGRRVEDEREQEAIDFALSEQARGKSMREIAKAMSNAGFRTKRGHSTWPKTTVARLLERAWQDRSG